MQNHKSNNNEKVFWSIFFFALIGFALWLIGRSNSSTVSTNQTLLNSANVDLPPVTPPVVPPVVPPVIPPVVPPVVPPIVPVVSINGGVFPSMFVGITRETQPDTFSPEKFKSMTFPAASKVSRGTMPKTMNNKLGVEIPNWLVVLHTDLSKVYKTKGIDLQEAGFLGSVDSTVHGVQDVDWKYFPWGSWSTPLPFIKRVKTYLGTMVYDFLSLDENGVRQRGEQIAYNTNYGNVIENGVSQEIFTSVDSEGANEDGALPVRRNLVLIKTIKDKFKGIFGYMYLSPLNSELGYDTVRGYPDANGNLVDSDINPIFKATENIDGINFKATDYELLAPIHEVSHYGETAGGKRFDGVRNCTPYGANKNIEHYLSRSVQHAEKNYYAFKKLGGKDLMFMQAKLICDRGASGWQYNDGTAHDSFTGYLTRDQAFKETLGTFFSGCHDYEWNRPKTGLISDCMNGFEGAKTLVETDFNFAENEKVSLAKMRTGNFEFSLWNAEYKLEGETVWRKENGHDLAAHEDNLLVRFMKKDNYRAIYIANPYNDASKLNLSVRWDGFEKSFTTTDWQSCHENEARKDYIFALYKV